MDFLIFKNYIFANYIYYRFYQSLLTLWVKKPCLERSPDCELTIQKKTFPVSIYKVLAKHFKIIL